MAERWILARETVIEVPGQRPDLGYTVFSGVGYFDSFEAVSAAIKELGLPLGWVGMRTTQDPWNLLFPDGVGVVVDAKPQPGDRERIDSMLRQVWAGFDQWTEQEQGLARTVWLHAEQTTRRVGVPAPAGWWTEELEHIFTAAPGTRITDQMKRAAAIAMRVARGERWDDEKQDWIAHGVAGTFNDQQEQP